MNSKENSTLDRKGEEGRPPGAGRRRCARLEEGKEALLIDTYIRHEVGDDVMS